MTGMTSHVVTCGGNRRVPVTATWSAAGGARGELRLPPGGGKLVRIR